eukprot:251152-Chlamydomonas_euryale.AAC.11
MVNPQRSICSCPVTAWQFQQWLPALSAALANSPAFKVGAFSRPDTGLEGAVLADGTPYLRCPHFARLVKCNAARGPH